MVLLLLSRWSRCEELLLICSNSESGYLQLRFCFAKQAFGIAVASRSGILFFIFLDIVHHEPLVNF